MRGIIKSAVAVAALITLVQGSSAQADTVQHNGQVDLTLSTITALKLNGSPNPAKDADCHVRFESWIGQKVATSYKINTSTLIESATSVFQSKTYELHPLGLSNVYAFGLFMATSPTQPIYAVLFSINTDFSNPTSKFVANLNPDTNCLISSNGLPLDDADSIRFNTSK